MPRYIRLRHNCLLCSKKPQIMIYWGILQMSASLTEEPTEHLFLYWNQKIFFSPLLYYQRSFVMQSVIMTHNEAQSPRCSEQEVMFFLCN